MNKYKNRIFFDADMGGGEGGGGESHGTGGPPASAGDADISRGEAAFDPVPKTTTGDRALPKSKSTTETTSSGSDGAGTEQGSPVKPAGFDASKFAKEFGDTLGTTLKPLFEKQTTEQAPKMTPEEAKKFLKIWEPDDAWYVKYDNLETRKDAVNEMRDGIALQADTLNQLRMNEAIAKLREEIAPGLRTVAETTERQREERLHTTYPVLKNPALKPLIDSIAQSFLNEKKTFTTEGELFKALADGVEAVLKVNNPEFKLETAATNGNGTQQPADRGGRQLPVTSPGGGGGTGRREGGDKPEPKRGLAIFGK